jgi:hypothetical protein
MVGRRAQGRSEQDHQQEDDEDQQQQTAANIANIHERLRSSFGGGFDEGSAVPARRGLQGND